jgi:hypothetical protein
LVRGRENDAGQESDAFHHNAAATQNHRRRSDLFDCGRMACGAGHRSTVCEIDEQRLLPGGSHPTRDLKVAETPLVHFGDGPFAGMPLPSHEAPFVRVRLFAGPGPEPHRLGAIGQAARLHLIDVKNSRSHSLSPLQSHRAFERKPALGLDPGVDPGSRQENALKLESGALSHLIRTEKALAKSRSESRPNLDFTVASDSICRQNGNSCQHQSETQNPVPGDRDGVPDGEITTLSRRDPYFSGTSLQEPDTARVRKPKPAPRVR